MPKNASSRIFVSSAVLGLSVCLSTFILELQATKRFMSDTNSFSATRAQIIMWRAAMPKLEREKLALSWSMLCSLTHQLVVSTVNTQPGSTAGQQQLYSSLLSATHPSPAPAGGLTAPLFAGGLTSVPCSAAVNARSIY